MACDNSEQSEESNQEANMYQPVGLIVKNLSENLFADVSLKQLFEKTFKLFGDCSFVYLSSFKKCVVSYHTCENAVRAKTELDGKIIHNEILLSIHFKEEYKKVGDDYLLVPKTEKLFLISPPASPPVGWEQKVEPIPVVNYDLLSAVAGIQDPGTPIELISKTDSTPSIVVIGCEDPQPREGQKQMKSMKSLPRHEVQTKRPPISVSS